MVESEIFFGLLVVVVALRALTSTWSVPTPAVQVVVGLALGLIPGFPDVILRPDIVFLLLVPPLVYSASYNTSWRDFRANFAGISLLAVGLVLFTVVGVAWVAHAWAGLAWGPAFVLGAVVSPTDAVAASSVSSRLSVPRRPVQILEGEGLVNDATGLTVFGVAVAAVVSGTFSWGGALWKLALAVGVGVLAGFAVGWLDGWLRRWVGKRSPSDPLVSTGLSLITPFVAYLVADQLGGSGILAVVAAGLYLGRNEGTLTSVQGRLNAGQVWGLTTYLLNGFAFLLIGLQLPRVLGTQLNGQGPWATALAALAVAVSVSLIRLVWVFPTAYLLKWFGKIENATWQGVLLVGWTGSRGVLSLAAALSLPAVAGGAFPQRRQILFLTFAVILFTLVVQGLSLPALVRALRFGNDDGAAREEHAARIAAAGAARARLEDMAKQPGQRGKVLDGLLARYQAQLRHLREAPPDSARKGFSSEFGRLEREAIAAERAALRRLRDDDTISDGTRRAIEHDLDLQEVQLEGGDS